MPVQTSAPITPSNQPFWKKVFTPNAQLPITRIIAITGSVGKTTVAHLIHHTLVNSGVNAALISSRGLWLGLDRDQDKFKDFSVNFAGAAGVKKAISAVFKSDCTHLILELPAKVIKELDISKYKFDSVVFTNVLLEPSMQADFKSESEYLDALFTPVFQVIPEGMAVLNNSADSKDWLVGKSKLLPQNIYAAWCEITPKLNAKYSLQGTTFEFLGGFFNIKLLGKFNLTNCLQAIQLCSKYVGIDKIDIALSTFALLPGRLEKAARTDKQVYVDYAYQQDPAAVVLKDFSELLPNNARLIVVTGAAGDRGPERFNIALSAVRFADVLIFASQDPRTKKTADINSSLIAIAETEDGALIDRVLNHEEFEAMNKFNLAQKIDRVQQNNDVPVLSFDADSPSGRYDAIDFAIGYAKPEDVILILGKGDDEVMDFGDAVYEWSDMKMVEEIMYERFYNSQSGLSPTADHQ